MDERRNVEGTSAEERTEAARRWLGGPGAGGERLARIFQVEPDARIGELEAEITELRARLCGLELELSELRPRAEGRNAARRGQLDHPVVDPHQAQGLAERNYRLHRCEQFAVYAGTRPVGVVEGVRYGSSTDRPDVLEVRGGSLGHHLLLVPVSEVEAIDPDEEVVLLGEDWSQPGIGRLPLARLEQLSTTASASLLGVLRRLHGHALDR
jgi:hypothetical protein